MKKVFLITKITSIDGEIIDLNIYKGKVILLVNVASYCGFTKQYTDYKIYGKITKIKD